MFYCLTSKLRLSREHRLFISIVSIFRVLALFIVISPPPHKHLKIPFSLIILYLPSVSLNGQLFTKLCISFLNSLPDDYCLSSLISLWRGQKLPFGTEEVFQGHNSYCCLSLWEKEHISKAAVKCDLSSQDRILFTPQISGYI